VSGAERLPRADRLLVPALAAAAFALYRLTAQEHLFGDGALLVKMATRGEWNLNKPLYPPVARLLARLVGPLGLRDPRAVLELLSQASSAGAVAATYLAARWARLGRLAGLGGALLLALAPTVWFFATTVEVHALQLLVAALGLAWLARAWRADALGEGVLGAAVFLVLLTAAHPTGAFFAPCLLLLVAQAWRRGRRPRGVALGLVVLAAFGLYVALGMSRHDVFVMYQANLDDLAADPVRFQPRIAKDFARGAWALLPCAALGLVRRPPREGDRPSLVLPSLVLIASYLVALGVFGAGQRGAYCLSVFPALALGSAAALAHLPRAVAVPLFLAAAAAQGLYAHARIVAYDDRYAAEAWIADLEEEAGPYAVVLVLDPHEEGAPMVRFSTLMPLTLNRVLVDMSPEELVDWTHRHRRRVAILRSLHEAQLVPAQAGFLAEITRLLGTPAPGGRPEYLLFPARSGG